MKLAAAAAAACLLVLSHIALSSGSGGHHAVVDTPDPEILSNYSAKVSESLTLDPPKILSESGMSVGDLIRKVYKNPDHQLVLTVLVNNYSRFKLSNLKTSLNENCAYTNQTLAMESIEPGSTGLLIADNSGGTRHYGLCGTASWRLDLPSGVPILSTHQTSRRLVVTYRVPYPGGCLSESRGNKYSVGFSYVRVDPGHNDSFWLDWARGRFVEFERTSEVDRTVLFDQGRFMVRGRMEQGCTPLLQVDFMPGPMFQGDLAVSAEALRNLENAYSMAAVMGGASMMVLIVLIVLLVVFVWYRLRIENEIARKLEQGTYCNDEAGKSRAREFLETRAVKVYVPASTKNQCQNCLHGKKTTAC